MNEGKSASFFFIDFLNFIIYYKKAKEENKTHVKYSILKQNLHKEIKNIYIYIIMFGGGRCTW